MESHRLRDHKTSLKSTLMPLPTAWLSGPLPFSISADPPLSVIDITGLFKPEHFHLWRSYLQEADREYYAGAKFGLVNHFHSAEHSGRPEQESQDLIRKVAICLRVVKPTNVGYAAIQFIDKGGKVDILNFDPRPEQLNSPEVELLNWITDRDLHTLRDVLPSFLTLASRGPLHVRRALNFLDLGYLEVQQPVIQLITWCLGIEAFFAQGEKPTSKKVLLRKLVDALGPTTRIYPDTRDGDVTFPDLTVQDTASDLFTIRDRFVHGVWTPTEWSTKPTRPTISDTVLLYPDILREAASFMLRTLLLKYLRRNSEAGWKSNA